MSYKSYKGRKVDNSKPVMVYKNLHNGLFSIKQGGLVVGHALSLRLNNVLFQVNEAGRQRVIKEKKKNVHAYICGNLLGYDVPSEISDTSRMVSYNPYKGASFYFKDDGDDVLIDYKEQLFLHAQKGVWKEK